MESSATPSSPAKVNPAEKAVRIGQLMDLYGGLLTERQRLFVQLHYDEDLSFGEIGRTHGVSRQAIHDAVKHAEQSLEDYESKLCLLERGIDRTPAGERAADEPGSPAPESPSLPQLSPDGTAQLAALSARLRGIHDKLRRSGGIIYNAEGVTREIGDTAAALEEILAAQRAS